jgi:hypothetical protein
MALADGSRFGGAAAPFRNAGHPGYVDTLAYAAYRRQVFANVGGFDERLERNQDNEMHARMRAAGYKFYYHPDIRSFHKARKSLRGLLRQKFENGAWIGPTLAVNCASFRLRHFAPALFLGTLGLGLGLAFTGRWFFLAALAAAYALAAAWYSLEATREAPGWRIRLLCLLLPLIFLTTHISYGLGTMASIFRMPRFIRERHSYVPPRPVNKSNGSDKFPG